MKKIIITIFCSFLCVLSGAVTFDVAGIRYEITSMEAREVVVAIIPKSISYPTYSTYSGDITIPESVEFNNVKFKVIGIGKNAFSECSKLGKITMPKSIKSIDFGAFSRSNIDTITIHEGIEYIGAAAFHDCQNIKYITLPKSIQNLESDVFRDCTGLRGVKILTDNLTEIPDDTFEGCSSLENFVIPSSVTRLGAAAFMGTGKLSKLEIPNSVKIIGNSCFYRSGIESLVIPDAVTELNGQMFYYCNRLKTIKLPSNLKELTKNEFRGCSVLESIDIPKGIKNIPSYCFYECYNLKDITLPSSIEFIGDDAFTYCQNIENVKIPEGVKYIYSEAFYGCKINQLLLPSSLEKIGGWAFGISELKELILPVSLKEIGTEAFNSGRIEKIVCLSPVPIECENSIFSNDTYLYSTLVVPQGCLDLYKSTNPWKNFFNIQQNTQTHITEIANIKKNETDKFVNINGQEGKRPFNGINIIRMKDGKTKKVIVR